MEVKATREWEVLPFFPNSRHQPYHAPWIWNQSF